MHERPVETLDATCKHQIVIRDQPLPVLLMKKNPARLVLAKRTSFSPLVCSVRESDETTAINVLRRVGPSYPTGRPTQPRPGSGRVGSGRREKQVRNWADPSLMVDPSSAQDVDRHLNSPRTQGESETPSDPYVESLSPLDPCMHV